MAATKAASSPLAQAIDEFLEGMKIRDRKTPFYEKVLTSRAVLALKDNPQGVQQCEDRLLESVKELEKQKRSTKTLKTLGTLTPFVEGLKSMIDTCASLLQASPFAVGVAFTGASFVLSLVQKTNSLFENAFTALDEIGSCLQCYAKFSVAYETSDEVRERLVASYKTIVSFFSAATNLLSKNVLVGAFKNVFNPLAEPIDATIETLRQDRDKVSAIAQAEEAVRANQHRIHEKAEEERRLREGILDWISAGDDLDVRGDLQMHTERRHSKTCSWLFEDEQFQRWRDSTPTTRDAGGSVFWYNAPPGSGKTVLSTAVIEHLNSRNSPTACFFYSFSDYTRRQALTALRAVAIQLLSILKTGIPGRVVELYHDEMSRNARYMQIPGVAIEVVHELLKQCSSVYVVVDGLDECLDDDKMRGMLTSIASAPTYGATKWFFTSRPDVHIRDMMSRLGALTLSPSVSTLQSEIRLFLADGLEHLPDKIDEYVEYSEGSFLYSRFLLDTLRGEGVTCEDDIRRALHAFPKGLTGYYVRSLLKLCERTDFEQELVQRIFMILVTAVQSMTWNELRNALAIRQGASDHSASRVPSEKTVHTLCGSLLVFDRSLKDHENNPKIKLCHKTFQDFLLEDPQNLPISKSLREHHEDNITSMQKFFIDDVRAFEHIGRDCITLLNYRRYGSFSDAKAILDAEDSENAFLKYAAAFWFLHFMDITHHRKEVFEEIQRFLESPNFWTCIAVQSYVVPYLFGRYEETARGCYKMGLRRTAQCQNDCFGVPLPIWLENYPPHGPELDLDFCSFVSDWHEVLASRPGTLDQCVPLSSMKSRLGDNFQRNERIRVWKFREKMGLENVSELHVNSISLFKGKLLAEIICTHHDKGPNLRHYHCVSIFSKDKKMHVTFDTDSTATSLEEKGIDFQLQESSSEVRVLEFDESKLHLQRKVGRASEIFPVPDSWKLGNSDYTWRVKWQQSQKVSRGKIVIFHVAREAKKPEIPKPGDSDSESEESDSDSDSESDSDSDSGSSSGSNYDSGYEEGQQGDAQRLEKAAIDWVVIVDATSQPVWLPLKLDKRQRGGIALAAHPTQPVAVVGLSDERVIIANTETGKSEIQRLPSAFEDNAAALVICQELHFSSCGLFMYCLTVSFKDEPNYAQCDLTFSTSRYVAGNLQPSSSPTQRITYKLRESLESLQLNPLLSHWTDNDLVVALPPLTCEPKLVKFRLPRPSDMDDGPTAQNVQTLQDPIYFPSSTTASSPVLLYRHRSKDHELFLCLTRRPSTRRSGPVDGQTPAPSSSPVVIRWKIPHDKGGWRCWDPSNDEESEDLKRGVEDHRILRGRFVDGDRRFHVPIRSGLDWTRKAYLSCA